MVFCIHAAPKGKTTGGIGRGRTLACRLNCIKSEDRYQKGPSAQWGSNCLHIATGSKLPAFRTLLRKRADGVTQLNARIAATKRTSAIMVVRTRASPSSPSLLQSVPSAFPGSAMPPPNTSETLPPVRQASPGRSTAWTCPDRCPAKESRFSIESGTRHGSPG